MTNDVSLSGSWSAGLLATVWLPLLLLSPLLLVLMLLLWLLRCGGDQRFSVLVVWPRLAVGRGVNGH